MILILFFQQPQNEKHINNQINPIEYKVNNRVRNKIGFELIKQKCDSEKLKNN